MKKIIAMLVLCMVVMIPQSVFASSLDLDLKCSDNVAPDENFTVNIVYSSDSLGSVNGSIEYDTDYLEYISGGSSTGDGGIVKLKDSSDDGKTVTFELEFKALKKGTATVSVNTEEAYDLDEQAMNTPYFIKNISIEKTKSKETSEQTQNDDKNKTDSDDSEKQDSDAESAGSTQEEQNSRMLVVSSGITAILLATVGVVAGVRKRKRSKN